MTITTAYSRLGCDTQGDHLEVRTVYSGSKDEIDLMEESVRSVMGDVQTVEVFVNGEKPAGSTHSSTSGMSPREQLDRQAEFVSSTQDEACAYIRYYEYKDISGRVIYSWQEKELNLKTGNSLPARNKNRLTILQDGLYILGE